MEKIVNKLINDAVVGADRYANNGSTWLIFTETKQWVIELTEEKTLWYNYNFFKNLFSYLSFDVVENQHYITKWVEDTIINGVKGTNVKAQPRKLLVEDTIQNGVKHTPNISLQLVKGYGVSNQVENTIKNGVKETKGINGVHGMNVAIQNGVKKTDFNMYRDNNAVEDTIQNGVKYVGGIGNPKWVGKKVEDTIQNGAKETKIGAPDNRDYFIEDAIQNGVKHTEPGGYLGSIEMKGKIVHQLESPKQNEEVEDVIENGVKQTCAQIPSIQPVVERILEEGILQTKPMDEWVNTNRIVDKVMTESIKETLWMNGDSTNWGLEDDDLLEGYDKIEDTINNGIKEVHPLPAQDGNRDWGKYYHGKEDRTKPFNEYLNDVIESGIKFN